MYRKFLCLVGWFILLLLVLSSPRSAAQGTDREYEFKAVYLYNFLNYVPWPKGVVPGDDKMFVVGVLGKDPFGANLDVLGEKTVKDKKISVRRFVSLQDLKPCHLLFVASEDQLAGALAKTKGLPVLLVSDTPGLAEKGTAINLYLDDQNTVKFEINIDAEKRAGLVISSQLKRLAKIVRDAKETN